MAKEIATFIGWAIAAVGLVAVTAAAFTPLLVEWFPMVPPSRRRRTWRS